VVTGDDDHAAALERGVLRGLLLAEARDLLAVAVEARVEPAVDGVAREGEVAVADAVVVVAGPDGDDLAVALDQDRRRRFRAAEVRAQLAVTRERPVELAVRVVAGEAEVGCAPAEPDLPGDDDPAVGLDRDRLPSASKSVITRPPDPNSSSRVPSGL
jgi:hypothetical protein